MPRFSIVIPARNRHTTLPFTLKTCENLDGDYEVIVHDGASDPELTAPSWVRLYRTHINYSMCTDWNMALSYAKGEYVILFGCDDGILPHALTDMDNILREMNNPPLVRWNRCYYTWKDNFFSHHSGELQITLNGSSFMLNSKKLIAAIAQRKMDYTFLPMLYTAAIRRDLLDTLIKRTGRILSAVSPDVYSGFALASLVDQVPSIGKPMTINACSRWSTGVNWMQFHASEITNNFKSANERDGFVLDKRLQRNEIHTLRGAILDSFYQTCKNNLTELNSLNAKVTKVPEFDGRVDIKNATDVFHASVIAGDILKNVKYSLDFKKW